MRPMPGGCESCGGAHSCICNNLLRCYDCGGDFIPEESPTGVGRPEGAWFDGEFLCYRCAEARGFGNDAVDDGGMEGNEEEGAWHEGVCASA